MKNVLLFAAILLLQVQAKASLSCEAKVKENQMLGGIVTMKLVAGSISTDEKTDQVVLKNVTVDVKEESDSYSAKASTLTSDLNYKPKKYANHHRVMLTEMTPTSKQDNSMNGFYPSDLCEIQVLIPDSYKDGEGFKAPTIVHCDQSGGVVTMDCNYF
jgi:hypothetical protein